MSREGAWVVLHSDHQVYLGGIYPQTYYLNHTEFGKTLRKQGDIFH